MQDLVTSFPDLPCTWCGARVIAVFHVDVGDICIRCYYRFPFQAHMEAKKPPTSFTLLLPTMR